MLRNRKGVNTNANKKSSSKKGSDEDNCQEDSEKEVRKVGSVAYSSKGILKKTYKMQNFRLILDLSIPSFLSIAKNSVGGMVNF